MQKKSPLYVLFKEDTVWSMEHLNRYINDKFCKTRGLPRDWVFTTFTVRAPLPAPRAGPLSARRVGGGLVPGTFCRGSHVHCGSWRLGGACGDSLLPLSQMRSFTQHTRRPVGVPVAQRKRIRRGTVRLRVGSLAPLRG